MTVSAPMAAAAQTAASDPRLVWRLLMNDLSQGQRGTGAREDANVYQPASFMVHQGAPYVLPAVDARSGVSITSSPPPNATG